MDSNKTLKQIENEINYFDTLVSIQNEPYRYNWVGGAINENIEVILNWINKQWEDASLHELKHAFILLNIYTILLETFYKNHPYRINDAH